MILDGLELAVLEGVYPPSEDTFLLMDAVRGLRGGRALELCSGTGAVGLSVARGFESIVAVDLNPIAVRNTLLNYRANGLGNKLDAVVGDLFSPLGGGRGEFDLILMNPPYLPDFGDDYDLAWSAGADGRRVLDRFMEEAARFLAPTGRGFFLQSTLNGAEESLGKLRSGGLRAEIVLTADFQFEGLAVIEFSHAGIQKTKIV